MVKGMATLLGLPYYLIKSLIVMIYITARPVPFGFFGDIGTYGPQMSQIGDGNELLMTYEKQIYSFHCDDSGPESTTQCFWSNNDQLQVERQYHVMMTVPSSIVEDC